MFSDPFQKSGKTAFKTIPSKIPTDMAKTETSGTRFFDNFKKTGGNSFCCANVYNIRDDENRPEFKADAAAVNITKLMIPAAAVIPTLANVSTNGEPTVSNLSQG